jgi:hypothetical protein
MGLAHPLVQALVVRVVPAGSRTAAAPFRIDALEAFGQHQIEAIPLGRLSGCRVR